MAKQGTAVVAAVLAGAADGEEVLPDLDTRALKVDVVADRLDLSRAKVYQLINSGELPVIRLGSCLRVPARALADFIRARTLTGDAARPDPVRSAQAADAVRSRGPR